VPPVILTPPPILTCSVPPAEAVVKDLVPDVVVVLLPPGSLADTLQQYVVLALSAELGVNETPDPEVADVYVSPDPAVPLKVGLQPVCPDAISYVVTAVVQLLWNKFILNCMSSLSGSVSLKVNVGVVDTPDAPEEGAVSVGVLGGEFAEAVVILGY